MALRNLALAGLAAVALATAGQAQPSSRIDSEIAARERATNRSLLDALLQRRAEVAAAAAGKADQRPALEFLDRRIAELRARLGE